MLHIKYIARQPTLAFVGMWCPPMRDLAAPSKHLQCVTCLQLPGSPLWSFPKKGTSLAFLPCQDLPKPPQPFGEDREQHPHSDICQLAQLPDLLCLKITSGNCKWN